VALKVTSKTTKAEIASELERVLAEQKQYKEHVARVALEQKENEGWCSEGFREAMEELDLEDFLPDARRIVILKVEVDASKNGYDPDQMDESDWANAAISNIRYHTAGDLYAYDVEDVPKDN
jgi:phenylpyruvate tautomerase PptA (4-oxalocrotonate tautomerase family)